jgi:hypothetical protein
MGERLTTLPERGMPDMGEGVNARRTDVLVTARARPGSPRRSRRGRRAFKTAGAEREEESGGILKQCIHNGSACIASRGADGPNTRSGTSTARGSWAIEIRTAPRCWK